MLIYKYFPLDEWQPCAATAYSRCADDVSDGLVILDSGSR